MRVEFVVGIEREQARVRSNARYDILYYISRYNFDTEIVFRASQIFDEVTRTATFRGSAIKSIVFGCLFLSFKQCNNVNLHLLDKTDDANSILGLSSVEKSRGINRIVQRLPHLMQYVSTPVDIRQIIYENMKKINGSDAKILQLFKVCDDKAEVIKELLKVSQPKSVAVGLIYRFMLDIGSPITVYDLSGLTGISHGTIKRVAMRL